MLISISSTGTRHHFQWCNLRSGSCNCDMPECAAWLPQAASAVVSVVTDQRHPPLQLILCRRWNGAKQGGMEQGGDEVDGSSSEDVGLAVVALDKFKPNLDLPPQVHARLDQWSHWCRSKLTQWGMRDLTPGEGNIYSFTEAPGGQNSSVGCSRHHTDAIALPQGEFVRIGLWSSLKQRMVSLVLRLPPTSYSNSTA